MNQQQTPLPRPLTPLEKLQAGKKRLKQRSIEHEEALAADFLYIQENAANLLLVGISSLLFPGSKAKKTETAPETAGEAGVRPSQPMGLTDYLSIAGNLAPVAWGIVQPLLISLAVKQVKRWVGRLFFKRKK